MPIIILRHLSPNLGVVDLDGGKGFVIADIPGIIEGASEGVGLGHEFLRHIERTRVIIHIVDAAGVEGRDPINDIRMPFNKELDQHIIRSIWQDGLRLLPPIKLTPYMKVKMTMPFNF